MAEALYQRELADAAGLGAGGTAATIELGESYPSADTIVKLAKSFKVEAAVMLDPGTELPESARPLLEEVKVWRRQQALVKRLSRNERKAWLKEVGARFMALRLAAGFKQEELADAAQLGGLTTVCNIELGKCFPWADTAIKLAKAFGMESAVILDPSRELPSRAQLLLEEFKALPPGKVRAWKKSQVT